MNCTKLSTAILVLLAGCGRSAMPPDTSEITPPAKIEITENVIEVAKDGNQFATELYSRLSAEKETNLCFSPYSVSTALAMTYAGADGETKSQMGDVLHFSKQDSEFHPAMSSLRMILTSRNKAAGVELRVANRLWGQKNFHFLPEFLGVTKSHYGAELGQLDFRQPEKARQIINSWVEKQTDQKIKELIAPGVIKPNTSLVLTNAIYFKGRWKHPFDKSLTKNVQFHVSATETVDVPMMMMKHEDQFRYAVVEKVQVLELPYGQDSNTSMLVLLPKTMDGLDELETRVANGEIDKWISGLKSMKVEVSLPKFRITSEFRLKDVLTSMGMSLAFSNEANFSRMSSEGRLFIDAVVHKAFVDVNEEGTEAAAATAGLMLVSKGPHFLADRPFMFLIRDNRSESILFIGRVKNPKDQG